ncbi:uncharacterized protein LOC131060052 isoform X2 [Cryptomeria japonica]|nr:uncharacterized protein LOC131060052 isoform X2 [Cryptomeria japonica]XP_057849135.2 uncharacterized protein LOC131060052 isoform X2 [Cryptomeria japonica]
MTKKNVQWVQNTGENAASSRSVKSPRKVMFSDDIQMHGSDDIKSRMGRIYSAKMNSRTGRKYVGDMNNRIGRRHSDKMKSRVSRTHSDKMESRMGRSPFDDMNRGVGRTYSDDMNVRTARIDDDERNIRKDRKHSWVHAEKYSSYPERTSPFSLRAYQRRGPKMKDRNRVQNHHMKLLEQGICYDLKRNLHEWPYRKDNQIYPIKDKRILYSRRYFADMSHEREEQTAIDKPVKSYKKRRCHVKEIACPRNRDEALSSFSRRIFFDNFQNSERKTRWTMK